MKKLDLIRLGEELSKENDSAFQLWSWLPSHAVAERHHGDYAGEFCPSNADVMHEASLSLARLKGACEGPATPEEVEWFERCPCGEDHLP